MPGIVPTMREFKAGKLRSSSGQKVTNPKQAIAIGLSEADKGTGKRPGPSSIATALRTKGSKRRPFGR